MVDATRAIRIRVIGIVQGVGFRPYVYRLATKLGLSGYVVNLGGSEVEIYIEGSRRAIEEFLELFEQEKPPPAKLEKIEVEYVEPLGLDKFEIRKSIYKLSRRSMIPPDFGICRYCTEEVLGSSTRFSKYYWNSCAWCGPRFSMMYSVPYDRHNTAMKKYPLCRECRRDYEDPLNTRRFHAQGISCPICGPKTRIYSIAGEEIPANNPVAWASEKIEEGYIIAIKGVGGYHIAALATNDEVVAELRKRKKRPTKPFAVMARDCTKASEIVEISSRECKVLESPERPILLLPKKDNTRISELVAPGLDTIGVFLPYTGFQLLLLRRLRDGYIIMTSGNRSGYPMCIDLECVFTHLSDIVDYVVDHDREIVHRVDDSVLRYTDGELVFLRRARGYAPMWLQTTIELPEAVAVGAELQSAGAVSFEDKIVLTQFIGDLDEPGQIEDLERELQWLINTYKLEPKIVALDMHPLYRNRKLALELAEKYNIELVEVQHHHAHAASAMIEHNIEQGEKRIAITIDGVGYGPDKTIWGGEVLVASYTEYKRIGCLNKFPLPGGDRATTYPVRALIGILSTIGLDEEETITLLSKRGLLSPKYLPYGEREARIAWRQTRIPNTVWTTSMGRTLDAAAVLLSVAWSRGYEGEPAMRLEAAARGGRDLDFEIPVVVRENLLVVDTSRLFEWIIWVLEENKPVNDIALTVQKSLGRALGRIALSSSKKLGGEVIVSGGAAVNTYIIQGIREALEEQELKLLLQKKLPPGDGGIAAGQIAVAATKLLA